MENKCISGVHLWRIEWSSPIGAFPHSSKGGSAPVAVVVQWPYWHWHCEWGIAQQFKLCVKFGDFYRVWSWKGDRREREVIEISHLNELVNEFLCIAQVQSRELLLMVCCRAKIDDGLEWCRLRLLLLWCTSINIRCDYKLSVGEQVVSYGRPRVQGEPLPEIGLGKRSLHSYTGDRPRSRAVWQLWEARKR